MQRRGLRGALRRLGNTLGDLGWPLEQLNTWLDALSTLTKRSHQRRAAIVRVAGGVRRGMGRAVRARRCTRAPASTRSPASARPTVLRLRLKEIYQHCRAFGITPTEAYCFVIVDANTDDLAPFERDAVMITTAGVVGDVFHQGETVIRHRSRVIVLASKSESTRERVRGSAQMRCRLRRSHVRPIRQVWDGELPASRPSSLDRRLRDLVG